MKRKIKLVTMDLSAPDLGLTGEMRKELQEKLNFIVNVAGSVEFDARLDL
jgi:thioester reductase-like protein